MAPSATDYVHGLRLLWWIPLVTLLVGIGLGLVAASSARATATTTTSAFFTFTIADAGQESAGSARGAEAAVAQSRLAAYVQIARTGQGVRELIRGSGLVDSRVLISTADSVGSGGSQGILQVRISNGDLGTAEAADVVTGLTTTMIDEVKALDAQQATASLRPDVLVTEPLSDVAPAPRMARAAPTVLLLLILGLGIVYLLVWRRGRIYGRRDIEDRLGARVLGDMDAHPADAPAIALALCKGRQRTTTALLVQAGRVGSQGPSRVGKAVAAAGRELGLEIHWSPAGPAVTHGSAAGLGAAVDSTDLDDSVVPSLTLVDACVVGLCTQSLRAAATVDIVALIVEYGETSYRELSAAGKTLAELTEAEIAVIGVHGGGISTAEPRDGTEAR